MLDTKLKNKKRIRKIIITIVFVVALLGNILYFPLVCDEAKEKYEADMAETQEINTDLLRSLYHGMLVMYYEQAAETADSVIEPYDLFVKEEVLSEEQKANLKESFTDIYGSMVSSFEQYRYQVDYYATNGKMSESNAAQDLEEVLLESNVAQDLEELLLYYRNLWIMSFDKLGHMQVKVITTEDISADTLIKSVKQIEDDHKISNRIASYAAVENENAAVNRMQDFTVIYGISKESTVNLLMPEEWYGEKALLWQHMEEIVEPAFFIQFLLIGIFAAIMNNSKFWKDIAFEKKEKYFVFELAVLGVCMLPVWMDWYVEAVYRMEMRRLENIFLYLGTFQFWKVFHYIDILMLLFLVIFVFYAVGAAFSPIISLGMQEYIRQYSFVYQILPQIKMFWEKFKKEIRETNLEENTTKTIVKIVVINFIVLAGCCCMWVVGILGLVAYSLAIFYVTSEYVYKIKTDYEELRKATGRIAEGDLNTVITESIGIFEPMKEDLTQIRTGFKKAVEEEVKSQRMKTELITNVSHDLKTPLTAITTYVELLKKEDITEAERREYVATLESKAQRLKVLIDDLFEVSKVSSNDITLNFMRVDLVKLMKQVLVEHKEKYDEAGLELYWSVPEEKTELLLDSQKTYRIFENLFMNIQKYAMQNSRVYIDVTNEEGEIRVVIKNISAIPLRVTGEELAERFVRGDVSRNTEGSGLGLAIAKNFTEVQNGTFEIVVDGDLFKTTLVWKNNIEK